MLLDRVSKKQENVGVTTPRCESLVIFELPAPRFSITTKILNALLKIERARGFLEVTRFSSHWLRKMRNKAMLVEAHHTTHIEGTQLSFAQSKRILTGRVVTDANSEDVKELTNYRDAFKLINKHLADNGDFSETFIKNIHRELVKDVRDNRATPGLYREKQNYIWSGREQRVTYTPPPSAALPQFMHDFVAWANTENDMHPVLKSGIIQFQFVYIHPFIDGNGRTSRLLCSFHLYKPDYDFKKLFSLSEYYDKDREKFYQAIRLVKENNMDMTGWLEYFVEGFMMQMNETVTAGKKIIYRDELAQTHNLSARKLVIIDHILAKGVLSPKDFPQLCIKISETTPDADTPTVRTLQRYLREMIEMSILQSEGEARQRTYYLKI